MLELFFLFIAISLLSFLCSMLEVAVFSQSINKIALLKDKDPFSYFHLMAIKKDPNATITSIVILNNFSNIVGSMFIATKVYDIFDPFISVIFSVFFTLFIIIFCEIIPKTIAERYSHSITLFFLYFLIFLPKLFKPLIYILSIITRLFYKERAYYPMVSEDEIRALAHIGKKEGTLKNKEVSLISRALILNDIPVKNIMIPRIKMKAINGNLKISSLKKEELFNFRFSKIPIYNDNLDQIIGIVYRNDVFKSILSSDESLKEKPIYSLKVDCLFFPENKRIDNVLEEIRKIRSHTAIIINEYGGTSGMITLQDVLEELVGDIYKHDKEYLKDSFIALSRNEIICFGTTSLEEISNFFKVEFQQPYISLSKFILDELKRFPKVGEVIKYKELTFIIGQTTRKTVKRVRILKQ